MTEKPIVKRTRKKIKAEGYLFVCVSCGNRFVLRLSAWQKPKDITCPMCAMLGEDENAVFVEMAMSKNDMEGPIDMKPEFVRFVPF